MHFHQLTEFAFTAPNSTQKLKNTSLRNWSSFSRLQEINTFLRTHYIHFVHFTIWYNITTFQASINKVSTSFMFGTYKNAWFRKKYGCRFPKNEIKKIFSFMRFEKPQNKFFFFFLFGFHTIQFFFLLSLKILSEAGMLWQLWHVTEWCILQKWYNVIFCSPSETKVIFLLCLPVAAG